MARKTSLRCQSGDEGQAEGSGTREASLSPSHKLESAGGNSPHPDAIGEIDYAEANGPINTEDVVLSEKTVKPLTPEALAAFNTARARSGVIYISRIPPGMQPAKVRHLLSQHGEVGRVYLQQEGGIVRILPSIFAKSFG